MLFKRILILFVCLLPLQLKAQVKLMVDIDDRKILCELKALTLRITRDTLDQKTLFTEMVKSSFNCDTLSSCDSLRLNITCKAFDYLGVKYRYGQSSEMGFDCSGFVRYIYNFFGLDLPHSSYGQYRICKHIKKEEARAGDLVFFITRGSGISHVGIYLGDNKFIHSPGRGDHVSVSSLNSVYYKRHFSGFGSILE